jgi:hypothetical protein
MVKQKIEPTNSLAFPALHLTAVIPARHLGRRNVTVPPRLLVSIAQEHDVDLNDCCEHRDNGNLSLVIGHCFSMLFPVEGVDILGPCIFK